MTDAAVDRAKDADPLSVSIVIPAYNAAATIADTLASVCAQEWTAWEAIVVDDGSTDDTRAIAADFAGREPRIRVVRRENGGEAAARNTGIAEARFGWLLFLDSDDWIAPQHLRRMTAVLASDPSLQAVHCRSARVAGDGTHIVEDFEPPTGDLFPTLAHRAAFNVHACVVRKDVVDEVGRFDVRLERLPDWDLWQRVARTGARFGGVNEVLAFYRMRPDSVSLDAHQLLVDGLRVLRQGHARDPRVPNPHPAYVEGMDPQGVRAEAFYFLTWCAGLELGAGRDARPLLSVLDGLDNPSLYPPAIAECLFKAAPLPTVRPPHAWDRLWFELADRIRLFLAALERHSGTAELEQRTLLALKTRILMHSNDWQPVLTDRLASKDAEIAAVSGERDALRRQTEELGSALRTVDQRIMRLSDSNAHLADRLVIAEKALEERTQSNRALVDRLASAERAADEQARAATASARTAEAAARALDDVESQGWVRLGRALRLARKSAHGGRRDV